MKTLVTGILLGQKREKTGEREREEKSKDNNQTRLKFVFFI